MKLLMIIILICGDSFLTFVQFVKAQTHVQKHVKKISFPWHWLLAVRVASVPKHLKCLQGIIIISYLIFT